jgi:hypothetical protein
MGIISTNVMGKCGFVQVLISSIYTYALPTYFLATFMNQFNLNACWDYLVYFF